MIFAVGNVRIVTEAKVEQIIMAGSSVLSNISRLLNAERPVTTGVRHVYLTKRNKNIKEKKNILSASA
jgi:hypothetical protein